MSDHYAWLILLVAVCATAFTRLLGPLLSKSKLAIFDDQDLLSRLFPLIIILTLVLKDLIPSDPSQPIQSNLLKLIASASVILLHLWKRNLFVSIMGGTALFIAISHFVR